MGWAGNPRRLLLTLLMPLLIKLGNIMELTLKTEILLQLLLTTIVACWLNFG